MDGLERAAGSPGIVDVSVAVSPVGVIELPFLLAVIFVAAVYGVALATGIHLLAVPSALVESIDQLFQKSLAGAVLASYVAASSTGRPPPVLVLGSG